MWCGKKAFLLLLLCTPPRKERNRGYRRMDEQGIVSYIWLSFAYVFYFVRCSCRGAVLFDVCRSGFMFFILSIFAESLCTHVLFIMLPDPTSCRWSKNVRFPAKEMCRLPSMRIEFAVGDFLKNIITCTVWILNFMTINFSWN